jgi:uncharacterized integral membrane protein
VDYVALLLVVLIAVVGGGFYFLFVGIDRIIEELRKR